jgi:short-subunit dehydrogenase
MNHAEQGLKGRVILVTGATSGIGLETARALTHHGAVVVGTGRDQERLAILASEVDLALTMDVTDPRSVELALAAIEDRYGRIDVLVNNAGIGCFLDWNESTAEDLERVLQVNLVGAVRVANGVLPRMVARGSGVMVSVASVAGLRGYPRHSAYCASKFGLVGWSRAIRKDLRGTGVSVSIICPPAVDTPFFETAGRAEFRQENKKNGMVSPVEVARCIVRAILDEQTEVVISGRARMLHALDRMAPSLVDRLQKWKGR